MHHRTIGRSCRVSGVGVHTGRPATVRLDALPPGAGIRFRVGDVDIPADIRFAEARPGSTVLMREGVQVRTPEHLLSAVMGLGITDLRVTLHGPELPIRDGSAAPWCADLRQCGWVDGPPCPVRVLDAPVRVESHGGVAEAWPSDQGHATVIVDFGDEALPRGECGIPLEDSQGYVQEIAAARTFVLARDVERLRAAGRGEGATPENTVVWGDGGPMVPLRMPDEPVRHKLLDLLGDLALAGSQPFLGRIRVTRGSHALHHALVEAIRQASSLRPATVD